MNLDSNQIIIVGMGSISALGSEINEIWKKYLEGNSLIKIVSLNGQEWMASSLSCDDNILLQHITKEFSSYRKIDRSVLMAIYASRMAFKMANWNDKNKIGISLGSSRGATLSWEKNYLQLLNKHRVSPLASPSTTLGNLSSWVAQDLNLNGPEISHSMTCTTGLHAIANGIAWLKSGLVEKFIAGGTEAPISLFTMEQFKSLKLLSNDTKHPYPCRPISNNSKNQNRLVIGEGSAVFALEKLSKKNQNNRIAKIDSIGFGVERINSVTSITKYGDGFQDSMLQAIKDNNNFDIDMIILHAPGTISGDLAELNAIRAIFGDNPPVIISNKWMIGHTLGSSGCHSLELAIHILHNDTYVNFPYPTKINFKDRSINTIMINSAGFGGNFMSIIVSR